MPITARRPAPPAPAPAGIDPVPHLLWARAIARGVRHDWRFRPGSAEEEELEGAARLELCRRAAAFDPVKAPRGADPVDAFRGYAAEWIRSECQREAARQRNGGTYRTLGRKKSRDAAKGLVAVAFTDVETEGGEGFDPAARISPSAGEMPGPPGPGRAVDPDPEGSPGAGERTRAVRYPAGGRRGGCQWPGAG